MHFVPISPNHVEHTLSFDPGHRSAWHKLQDALGGGLATAVLETPERRKSHPGMRGFEAHPDAPVADVAAAEEHFEELLAEWHFAFETLMNGRWDLVENPFAKAWIMPGMILLHEDPLCWAIDLSAEEIAAGDTIEEPKWALLMPKPGSNHALIEAGTLLDLPHADILTAALTAAAEEEGHDEISPLSWKIELPEGSVIDTLEA